MIYILLLEENKWYIGYTDRKNGDRFQEHFSGNGSKWTQLYKPIQVMEWREGTLEEENKITLEYMEKYGWWNVRGGSYCQVEMTKPPKQLIPEMPVPIAKLKRIYKNGKWSTIRITPSYTTQKKPKNVNKLYNKIKKYDKAEECYRCGRKGHLKENCYAKTILKKNHKNGDDNECEDEDEGEYEVGGEIGNNDSDEYEIDQGYEIYYAPLDKQPGYTFNYDDYEYDNIDKIHC